MNSDSGDKTYLNSADRLIRFLCWTQETKETVPALSGGISGSYPFNGEYGKWCVLNWATKFFADSMMDFLYPASVRV
jgi:hypothetical protein